MHSLWEVQTFFSAALTEQSKFHCCHYRLFLACPMEIPDFAQISLFLLLPVMWALFLCFNRILGSFLCSIFLLSKDTHTCFWLWEPPENDAGPWLEVCYTCVGQCSFRAPWKNSFLLGKGSIGSPMDRHKARTDQWLWLQQSAQPWQVCAGAGSPSSQLSLCLEVVWQAQVCPELCFSVGQNSGAQVLLMLLNAGVHSAAALGDPAKGSLSSHWALTDLTMGNPPACRTGGAMAVMVWLAWSS